MKITNRIFSVLLIIFLIVPVLCSAVPVNAALLDQGTCGDNLTWTLTDDGVLKFRVQEL